MQGFKSAPYAQRSLTTHAAIYKAFYVQRHLMPADPASVHSAVDELMARRNDRATISVQL